jgi:RimJ/RimL family protein N-acetyltransferase
VQGVFHRTQRLFLRPAFPEDWEAIYDGVAEEAITRNLARAPWPYLPHHAQDFAARGQDPQIPNFAIILPDAPGGARLIGMAGLLVDEGETLQIGYWIARAFWGHGFATEAACGVLEVARMLGHARVFAGHFADNPASGAVLRKAGFKPCGTTRMAFSLARGQSAELVDYAINLTPEPSGELRRAA